jgi:phosphomevalonate kinase
MTRRLRWSWIAPAFLVAVVLSAGSAAAADKTKVDEATHQVAQGARQIGQGQVGSGFKEFFVGIGNTIVEGAKFTGENIKELFQKQPASAS